jgi:putative tricarboxylic transport membrane protein
VTALLRTARAGEVAVFSGLTLLGAAALIGGLHYGMFAEHGRVGPGMMPAVSGALLCLLGAVLTMRALQETETAEATPDGSADGDPEGLDIFGRSQLERIRHLWVVFALLLVTILAVTVLGFLVAFGAFVMVVSVWVERRKPASSLLIAVGACLVIYLVFELFLRVPLPTGLLGI